VAAGTGAALAAGDGGASLGPPALLAGSSASLRLPGLRAGVALPGSAGGIRVLFVDSSAAHADAARRLCRRLGCDVLTAGGAAEALARAREGCPGGGLLSPPRLPFDIVFVDVALGPGAVGSDGDGADRFADGFALARRLRREEELAGRPRVPVVAYAGATGALLANLAWLLEAGMDDVLARPASLASLRAVLRKWFPAF
jgi:CheY-like chemotaxis protein